jgi:DNA-binding NarL/FixJ family response regulator
MTPAPTTPPQVRTATVVAADDRPLVRAGLRAVLSGAVGVDLVADVALDRVVETVEHQLPSVLVTVTREHHPDPFRVVATVKALHPEMRVLAIADAASVIDLREAVVSGVDSFLLTDASERDISQAVTATARGERVVSPEVAMRLAGSWRPDQQGGASSLTPRELHVLALLAEGLTNQEVGARLELSARTVKTHVQNLLGKLDVPDRTGAVARAFRMGLIR